MFSKHKNPDEPLLFVSGQNEVTAGGLEELVQSPETGLVLTDLHVSVAQ